MFYKGVKYRLEYFKRYRKILKVLLNYGFGHIVEKLNLEFYLEYGEKILLGKRRVNKEKIKLKGPERLRLAFEELGPTFIKFGQILSTRPDMIPLEYIKELEKLQDKVISIEYEKIKEIIKENLNLEIEEVFYSIDEESLGSASIAQVHKAVLNDGHDVVIKVKKPGVEHIIEIDIAILYNIANLIEKKIPELSYYNPVKMVDEFSSTIKKELDFTREARNNDIVRYNFEGFEKFKIPKIFWDYTNENILLMEYVKGTKLRQLLDDEEFVNRKDYAELGAKIFLKQILEDGFFHADPHPGNIIIDGDKDIVFIDYGMVGVLEEASQENMAEILEGIVLKDVDKILEGFKNFEVFHENFNERALKSELKDLLEKYYNMHLKSINLGRLMDEIYRLVIRYKIYVPADFFLVGKTLMIIDGIGRSLDPEFDMVQVAAPFVKNLLKRKYSPERIYKQVLKHGNNYKKMFENIPTDISLLLDKVKRDDLTIGVKSNDLRNFGKIMDRVVNRLAASIIIAGLIIGSSLVIESKTGLIVNGYSIIGLTGFVVAGFVGILLLIDIIRK